MNAEICYFPFTSMYKGLAFDTIRVPGINTRAHWFGTPSVGKYVAILKMVMKSS